MWKIFVSMIIVIVIISYFWVEGIDHPDNKGDGFLD